MNLKTLGVILAALVLSAVVVLAADNSVAGIKKPNAVPSVNLSKPNETDPMDLSALTGPFFKLVDLDNTYGCPCGMDCGGDSGGDSGDAGTVS